MVDVLDEVDRWLATGRRVALATVVHVHGSAPRPPGARMAVNDLGEVAGSVSGGCVESAVVLEGLDVLGGGAPRRREYGISDDAALSVGLSCGGTLSVFVEPVDW